jgi:hypothetical protein
MIKGGMVRASRMHERRVHAVFHRKIRTKETKWEDNISLDIREIVWAVWTGFICLRP